VQWIVDMRSPYGSPHRSFVWRKHLCFPVVFTEVTSELLSRLHLKTNLTRQNDAELVVALIIRA